MSVPPLYKQNRSTRSGFRDWFLFSRWNNHDWRSLVALLLLHNWYFWFEFSSTQWRLALEICSCKYDIFFSSSPYLWSTWWPPPCWWVLQVSFLLSASYPAEPCSSNRWSDLHHTFNSLAIYISHEFFLGSPWSSSGVNLHQSLILKHRFFLFTKAVFGL